MNHEVISADGGCTGFPDGIGPWNWSHCCAVHDAGGSDGALVDCVAQAASGLPVVLILAAVTLMALVRPVYNFMQRRGWVK